jgi:peptide deformylase
MTPAHLDPPFPGSAGHGRVSGQGPPLDTAVAAFAAELAQWRQERGLTKKQLAGQMGFDPSYVSHVEGRRHRPTEDFAKRAEAVLRAGGAIWQRFTEYDQIRQARRNGGTGSEHWLPPGAGLVVERESASLTFVDGVYHCSIRRALFNTGPEPITRYPIKISVDRYPGNPQTSNEFYRRHPLTMDELHLSAVWGDGEPMAWRPIHDRDSYKEIWLLFENEHGRFPLYRGQRATIEYRYELGEDKWGQWFQRAVRLPTWELAVRLDFPAWLRPAVSGLVTSLTTEQPLSTPIRERQVVDRVTGERLVFEWATENPPLHARYRLDWRFRPPGSVPNRPAASAVPDRPSARMVRAGIRQRDDVLLRQRARTFVLPAQQATARDVVDRLRAALDVVVGLHEFRKGVGLAAPQLGLDWAAAVVRPPDPDAGAIVLLNPTVVGESTEQDERYEGCLSFFDVRGQVPRPLHLEVEHSMLDGSRRVAVFSDGMARLVAHEMDHLEGWLYDDRMRPGARLVPVEEYEEAGQSWSYTDPAAIEEPPPSSASTSTDASGSGPTSTDASGSGSTSTDASGSGSTSSGSADSDPSMAN